MRKIKNLGPSKNPDPINPTYFYENNVKVDFSFNFKEIIFRNFEIALSNTFFLNSDERNLKII